MGWRQVRESRTRTASGTARTLPATLVLRTDAPRARGRARVATRSGCASATATTCLVPARGGPSTVARAAGAAGPRPRGGAAGVPERVPAPGRAAVRGGRRGQRRRAELPVPRLAVPARRFAGAGPGRRRARRLRRRRLPAAVRVGLADVAAVGVRARRSGGGTVGISGRSAQRSAGTRWSRMQVVLSETHERPFNWKVLLENYSENYHTPFVHPEIDTSSTHDYPMVSDGHVLYAWDRPLRPITEAGDRMATLLPGEPGWRGDRRPLPTDAVRRRQLPHDLAEPDAQRVPRRGAGDVDGADRCATAPSCTAGCTPTRDADRSDGGRAGGRASPGAPAGRRHLHRGAAHARRRRRRRWRAGDGRGARRVLRAPAPAARALGRRVSSCAAGRARARRRS